MQLSALVVGLAERNLAAVIPSIVEAFPDLPAANRASVFYAAASTYDARLLPAARALLEDRTIAARRKWRALQWVFNFDHEESRLLFDKAFSSSDDAELSKYAHNLVRGRLGEIRRELVQMKADDTATGPLYHFVRKYAGQGAREFLEYIMAVAADPAVRKSAEMELKALPK